MLGHASPVAHRLRSAGPFILPMLSGGVFLGCAMFGLSLSRSTGGIAALWPANAILLSALVLSGPMAWRRHLPWCAAAGLLANWHDGCDLALSAAFALANVVSATVTFSLLPERTRDGAAFEDPASITRFLVAATIGVSSGATLSSFAVWVASGDFLTPWLAWFTSDLLGMILVTPVVLAAVLRAREVAEHGRSLSNPLRIWPLASVLIVSIVVFDQSRYPLLFVPLAAVMVATYRLGLLGAIAGTIIVAAVGSLAMAAGDSPIAVMNGPMSLRIQFFQFYLATLYGTSMPLAMLLSDRSRLTRERTESDRRHRLILDRSREVVFETDLAGHWTYLNPAWERLTGHRVEDSIGRSLPSALHEEDRAEAMECLGSIYCQEKEECHFDLRLVHADGQILWVAARSHLLTDEQGIVVGTHGTIRDVSARMAAQAGQIESERLYRLLADHSNDMIVQFGPTGVRKYVSPASETLLGFTPDELVGQPAAGAIHPEDRAKVLATCRTLLKGVENPICSYRQLHKNGRYVWLEASYRAIFNPITGEIDGFIASVRDVGRRAMAELERTRAAAQLEEANRLLLMAEEMSAVGHWRVDVASGMVYWSDMVCAIHGRPRGYSPIVATAIDAYHPDDRADVQAAVDQAVATGRGYAMKARIIRTDKVVRHVLLTGRAELAPDGSVTELFGVFQDVTEAHEAQTALVAASERVASSNRMLTMAEAVANLGHWRIDKVAGTLFWSDETYRIYGATRLFIPTIEGAYALYHPDDIDRVKAVVREALTDGRDYMSRARIIRPDGTARHILTRGEVEFDAAGNAIGLFGIVQDITEQVTAEERRQAQAEQYVLITEQASDMICLTDAGGVFRFASPSSKTVLGYAPEELVGTTAYGHVPLDDHYLLDRHRHDLAGRPAGEVVPVRLRMKRKDGLIVWIDIAARLASYGDDPRFISVCRDVSAQVAVEDELREAQTEAEAAVAAKSSFLANMSHEIRTPMNGVVGFAELLLAGRLGDEQRRQAELIADSGRAMMRLLNDILDLSKVEAGQMTVTNEPFDLIHALKACIALVTPAVAQKGIDLHCDIAADFPAIVVGDALRVRQIVLNLLGNAAKFTLQGSITLSAALDPGGRLAIAVEDTGIGIAPGRQQAIFEQFAQADDSVARRFGGSGLGLAISSGLAVLMGGELTVDSQAGRGSRFTLLLPFDLAVRNLAAPAPTLVEAAPLPLRGADARILVAEDHDVNQLLTTAMLKRLGFTADLAEDGERATAMVEAAAAQGRPYSLVLMDMQMPGINGMEATRRIRAAGMDETVLPIVALTANAFPDDVKACREAGMQAHVAKPFSLEDLQAALSRWMPKQRPSAQSDEAFEADIRRRYDARKDEAIQRLDRLVRAGLLTDLDLAEVASLLHQLAGTAGMFGEGTLGEEAARLESLLKDQAAGPIGDRIVRSVEAMRRAA